MAHQILQTILKTFNVGAINPKIFQLHFPRLVISPGHHKMTLRHRQGPVVFGFETIQKLERDLGLLVELVNLIETISRNEVSVSRNLRVFEKKW